MRQRFQVTEEIRRLDSNGSYAVPEIPIQPCGAQGAISRGLDLDELQVLVTSVGVHNRAVLRVDRRRDQKLVTLADASSHKNGFSQSRAAVIHRCVRDFHACELAHESLEFEYSLQRSLSDFGLVWRVRGEKFSAADETINDRRNIVIVDTSTQERNKP